LTAPRRLLLKVEELYAVRMKTSSEQKKVVCLVTPSIGVEEQVIVEVRKKHARCLWCQRWMWSEEVQKPFFEDLEDHQWTKYPSGGRGNLQIWVGRELQRA